MLALGSSEAGAQTVASNLNVPAVATANSVTATIPAQSVSASLATSIEREATWLYKGGWPLYALVDRYSAGAPLSDEANCIATAVYFEARGEALEGQLA